MLRGPVETCPELDRPDGDSPDHVAQRDALSVASHFRDTFYACLTARRNELFELTDAVLCADGPVTMPDGCADAGDAAPAPGRTS